MGGVPWILPSRTQSKNKYKRAKQSKNTTNKQNQIIMSDDNNTTKTNQQNEELQQQQQQQRREREQAAQQLEHILNQTRPKGLGQGVVTGVNNILKGAVGAAGFAVLGPTLGCAVGMKNAGILGGVVGVAGGAIAGVLGAAAMAVGGAYLLLFALRCVPAAAAVAAAAAAVVVVVVVIVQNDFRITCIPHTLMSFSCLLFSATTISGVLSGVSQIGRGIVATPESIAAPRQGKWWNEFEGRWIKTSLPQEEATVLKGVPEDDGDILGSIQKEIDQSTTDLGGGTTTAAAAGGEVVVDPFYYECLDVPSNAEPAAIKRKYYVLARQYHPDKNPGNQEAADKFKDIAEAYQVLSDPALRSKYNKEGRKGLSADKTSTADGGKPDIDPLILFAFLFGSDKFQDYIGRLSTATSASIGDVASKISRQDARKIQKRRVTRLAVKLAAKVDPWVTLAASGNKAELSTVEEEWKKEAVELSKASYGYQLVTTIGQVSMVVVVAAAYF